MRNRRNLVSRLAAVLMVLAVSNCSDCSPPGGSGSGNSAVSPDTFQIVAGSENKDLQPILDRFAAEQRVKLKVSYLGSVDIALQLQSGSVDADALWPASSLWIQLADSKKLVRNSKSIARSPVVFGVKMSTAKELGWVNNPKVSVDDILKAAEGGRLRFAMTSATQSNSGAAAYLGFLSAMAGHPDVLLHEHLVDTKVQDKIRRLLGSVNRSSASSGWLRDLMVQDTEGLDAMVNYEAMVISANRDPQMQSRDPLCAVYPYDGTAIADFPFGYVDHGNAAKAAFFNNLQTYLLSPSVQKEMEQLGRRAGLMGMETSDLTVFNPNWCIDTKRAITPITIPNETVVQEALDLYQGLLRKPSFSVFVLDYSGSMEGPRVQQMKAAMRTVLDPSVARRYMLQASTRDVNIVVPFSGEAFAEWRVEGNQSEDLRGLLAKINSTEPSGGTALYTATTRALQLIENEQLAHPSRDDAKHPSRYFPAVILMTDGEATDSPQILENFLVAHPALRDVAIFSIRFGDASASQLEQISRKGRVYDGTKDLGKAMRDAKGNN